MELPEQDRQALIEAARRRGVTGSGGAAFGVMPSSGKRAEKLNASRDVNMPAQLARGWAAGTLGLPGDIESLGRMGINLVKPGAVAEESFLPTSEFYQEYLPGGDERPAAKFASGLGALGGGMGSTTLVRGAGKGAKAVGKALGPKAAEMAEGYLQRSGLAPSVIKPKGGNWLSGTVEQSTKPLKDEPVLSGEIINEASGRDLFRDYRRSYDKDPTIGLHQWMREKHPDVYASIQTPEDAALNNWVDTKLNKYIKNEMGTPEDPVRALAEKGSIHMPTYEIYDPSPSSLMNKRLGFGMPVKNLGKSEAAKNWESIVDRAIDPSSAGAYKHGYLDESILAENPWLEKVPDEATVYKAKGLQRDLGFDHLIDELRNATRADSDLPANLRYAPEDLKKVTMAQAVERVAKINEWRAAQKAEADAAKARNPATFTVKEYPEEGMRWVELKSPEGGELPEGARRKQISATQGGIDVPGVGFVEAKYDPKTGLDWERAEKDAKKLMGRKPLEDALKYEGDLMGHCVGGYCPDVESGVKRIYSLRDKKGEPKVTIETRRGKPWNERSGIFYQYPELEAPWGAYSKEVHRVARETGVNRDPNYITGYPDWLKANAPDVFEKHAHIFAPPADEIIQVKGSGKKDAAQRLRLKGAGYEDEPDAYLLPFVQDFVRSGNWSIVGDIQNTGLRRTKDVLNDLERKTLADAGYEFGEYMTDAERSGLQELWDKARAAGREGFAKGGLVTDTDAIAAKLKATGMDDQKAFMQALRMADARQEAHMAGGGLLKALKGSKTIGNYQALPLNLPRAPNLPPQEITKTADRIARQQMGEHVRKPKKTENLAGRSMKEAQRLKQLDIEIQPTKEIPTPTVVPERAGDVRIALPGDISVADQMLMSVDNLPIGSQQQGGPLYGAGKQDLDDPRFWASNEGPAQIFQNKVTDLSYMYETPEIMALHMSMGHDAMNFAQHFADANLRAIQASPVDPESARMFNQIIREGNEKVGQFPDFPGVENYKEAYEAMQKNPELRKWFNDRMKVDSITQPLGMPSGKEIEYAIMEPELRNMETSMTGLSVGRMKPGASLIPKSGHATYSHDIAGQALGRTKELTPFELSFPDATAHVRSTQRPQDFTGTIQKVFPHQVVDDQYINQLGEYYNRLKQIRGYKKGGEVKKTGLNVLNEAII
jgi:hypothetical protein